MSYATSLQMAYPPPYGPSTLLSDDLVHRTSVVPYYAPSSLPHRTGSHLLSDDFIYNPIGLAPLSYRSTTHPPLSTITDWQRDIPAHTSYASINNVREYSTSIGTTSNTNTASSVAHSVHENNLNISKHKLPIHQQNNNRLPNDTDRQPPLTTIWSSRQPKRSTQDEESTVTYRSMPELSAKKHQPKSPVEEIKKDPTPPPPPPPAPPVLTKQESDTPITEPEKQQEQPSTIDTHAWLTESRKVSPVNEQAAEYSWANKIDQLHTTQAQREKEKAKALRVLPNLPKKVVQKPVVINEKKGSGSPYQRRNASYFDSLFDGNYYRKTSTNQQNSNLSLSPPNKPTTNSPNKPKTTVVSKQTPPRKVPQYEPPPLTNRAPTITTTTWKKQGQNQNPNDSFTPRENVPKDTDERFREALQKFRSDRAEQQQRELTESTAKRLNYSNYVRRSTRDGSLRNVVKPLPWTDFMDTKKGNVYTLVQEEKKDLYNQSKWYGERVRVRNFALHNGSETARISRLFPIENEEPQSDEEQVDNDDDDSKSDSNSTVKSDRKKQAINHNMANQRSSRTTKFSDQSISSNRASEDGNESDFQSSRKEKKRVYGSSVPTTSTTEESDTDQTTKQRHTDDDLFTVREEKTLESLQGVRSKKR